MVTVKRANDPDTFSAAETAAKKCLQYAQALYDEYNTESAETGAKTFLDKAISYAVYGLNAMEEYRLTNGDAYGVLSGLLKDSSGKTGTDNDNLYYARANCGDNMLENKYDTVLKLLAETLGCVEEAQAKTVNGVKYDTVNSGCGGEIKNSYILAETEKVDSFWVARKTILALDFDSYLTTRGQKFVFANGCGWSVDYSEAKIVEGGLQIKKTAELIFAEKL